MNNVAPKSSRAPMGKLTAKQEVFIAAYLRLNNATAAYREAYDCSNSTEGTINVNACRLLKNPNVALRISAIRTKVEEGTEISIKKTTDEFAKAAFGNAIGDLRWCDKLNGLDKMAKILGAYKPENSNVPLNITVEVVMVSAPGVPR